MAKLAAMAILFCFVLFQVAAAVSTQGEVKWCPKKDVFTGGCGQSQCLLDFLGKYGARSMPKNCVCTLSGANKHSCTCQIVCGTGTGTGA